MTLPLPPWNPEDPSSLQFILDLLAQAVTDTGGRAIGIRLGRTSSFAFGFNAVGDISDLTVAHGLNRTPAIYGGWQANGGHFNNGVQMHVSSGSADATNIVLRGVCTRQPIAPTVGCDAFWIAIG